MARGSRRRGAVHALLAHPNATAALLFALLVLAYLWPALLGLRILSPLAALYEFTPWAPAAPPDVHGYLNPQLIDVPLAIYPWRELARGLLHAGTLPAWNPYAFAGVPLLANPQAGLFSVFSLPLWILPLNYGIGASAALKLWAAGFGTYLLVRELRLGLLPGLLAGVAFAFSALNILWLTHESLPGVAVMTPWLLWLVERTFAQPERRPTSVLGLAVAAAVALGGGHPGTALHALGATVAYALARAALLHDVTARERLRPLAFTAGGLALGLLLMAVLVIPEILWSRDTVGTLARHGTTSTLPGTQLPFKAIKTVLFPDWWGRPNSVETGQGVLTKSGAEIDFNDRTFYAGVVALLLAAVALAAREGWRRKAPFALIGFVALAIPLHAPGLYQLAEHLPGLELVQNQRMHFVFEQATAVLAAFGLQAVLDRPAGDRGRLGVLLAALAGAAVALVAIGPSATELGHLARHFASGTDFQSANVLALTSVAWFALLAAGLALALLGIRLRPERRTAIAGAVVLLAAFDMLHFAHGYQPIAPAAKAIPPRMPAIAYLQAHAGGARIAGLRYAMPGDWSLRYGLRDVRGFDPPYPTRRWFALWREANPAQVDWQPIVLPALTPAAVRVLSALGGRYVVTEPGTPAPRSADPALAAMRRVYDGPDATILSNPRAVGRALVAPAVRLADGADGSRAVLIERGFDPRRTAVVEREQPGAAALAGAPRVHGTVRVARERNAGVTLTASLDRRGLVVLDDALTPGWRVRVDGRPATPLRVDDVMRGVVVGAGRHEILWSYTVPGLAGGAALSALGLALLAAGAVAVMRRTRPRRRAGAVR